jgi:hypothetical protein
MPGFLAARMNPCPFKTARARTLASRFAELCLAGLPRPAVSPREYRRINTRTGVSALHDCRWTGSSGRDFGLPPSAKSAERWGTRLVGESKVCGLASWGTQGPSTALGMTDCFLLARLKWCPPKSCTGVDSRGYNAELCSGGQLGVAVPT